MAGLNQSFGEFGLQTRVSTYAGWIDSIIDEAGLPTVTDVRLSGSTWADPNLEYSYASLAAAGDQLKPIFTQGVDAIEIEFSEHVLFGNGGDELTLIGSTIDGTTLVLDSNNYTFAYDVNTHTGTWTFATPLPADKFRIELNSATITDTGTNALDVEWAQPHQGAGSFDNFADDAQIAFPSGNGVSNAGANEHFEFFFSYLPGDATQDGLVDAADAALGGDVNGDGLSNAADVTLINTTYLNDRLPMRVSGGDYRDDELVDVADYHIWRNSYGGSNPAADGNGDGIVDAADYSVWRDRLNDYSGWYRGPIPNGPAPAPVVWGAGPQVTNVTISGSASTHSPFSFDSVDGSGEQLRTVPVGGADTISITFSEDVNVAEHHLTLTGLLTANRPELAEFSYDIATATATWRFTSWALGDHYLVSLSDAVTDIEGTPLDGEWTNPSYLGQAAAGISEFPSGNGEGGGRLQLCRNPAPRRCDPGRRGRWERPVNLVGKLWLDRGQLVRRCRLQWRWRRRRQRPLHPLAKLDA